jgi:hypothetical protein
MMEWFFDLPAGPSPFPLLYVYYIINIKKLPHFLYYLEALNFGRYL